MGLMDGKVALVFGVANRNSIGWGIARKLHEQGATIALSYAGAALEKRVRPLAQQVDCDFVEICDVTSDAQLDVLFDQVRARYGRIDTLVHSVAYANREDLGGRFIDISREGFSMALDVVAPEAPFVAAAVIYMLAGGGDIMKPKIKLTKTLWGRSD